MNILKTTFFLLFLLCISCNNKDDNHPQKCAIDVIENSSQFFNAPDDEHEISNAVLQDGCLVLDFRAGGCDGDTWEIKIIDSGEVSPGNPPERTIRLSLKNDEDCEAYITKSVSIDISQLEIENSNSLLLNILGWDSPLEYNY